MAKYDQDRIFLERIRESMTKTLAELETRVDELNDQIAYINNAINALSVYEYVNPSASLISPATGEVIDNAQA